MMNRQYITISYQGLFSANANQSKSSNCKLTSAKLTFDTLLNAFTIEILKICPYFHLERFRNYLKKPSLKNSVVINFVNLERFMEIRLLFPLLYPCSLNVNDVVFDVVSISVGSKQTTSYKVPCIHLTCNSSINQMQRIKLHIPNSVAL